MICVASKQRKKWRDMQELCVKNADCDQDLRQQRQSLWFSNWKQHRIYCFPLWLLFVARSSSQCIQMINTLPNIQYNLSAEFTNAMMCPRLNVFKRRKTEFKFTCRMRRLNSKVIQRVVHVHRLHTKPFTRAVRSIGNKKTSQIIVAIKVNIVADKRATTDYSIIFLDTIFRGIALQI